MRSIGFDIKKSAYETQNYAIKNKFKCRVTSKKLNNMGIYFVWVNEMTIEQSEKVNEFARKKHGLLWLSTLRKDIESVNRGYDDFYS